MLSALVKVVAMLIRCLYYDVCVDYEGVDVGVIDASVPCVRNPKVFVWFCDVFELRWVCI